MMKTHVNRSLAVTALFFALFLQAAAQKGGKSNIIEANVRAQMQFLAGDALQGRGSGTVFERIAAEYIGSQFMQFGLEPAGEPGFDGKPTYVQTVSITRNSFAGAPTLKFGSTTVEHGKEFMVLRTTTDRVSGKLQKLDIGGKPEPGAAVFLRIPAGTTVNLNQASQAMLSAGASIVIVAETPQYRSGWAAQAARKVGYTVTSAAAKPTAVAIVDTATAGSLGNAADGTLVEFNGTLGSPEIRNTWNAMGKITGSDPKLGSEVILLSSHLDHLGVREDNPGSDKIFNGADDDASGSVAVLEMARTLASDKKRPKRTVYFICFGSEEAGGFGATYFVNNMPFPKEKFVANLEFEMIGRPDAKVKPEELWLTGYERSNLGEELARRGARLVQDPHPDQNFFMRSDNIQLARQGIIAHTVSSFGLHTDYHHASDEVKTIDFTHMTRAINSMVDPVKWLVNSDFVPSWKAGMRP